MDTDKAPRAWELLSEAPVADCKVFKIVKRTLRHPDGGRRLLRQSFRGLGAGCGPPRIPETRAASLRSARQPVQVCERADFLGVPGGIVEEGEPPRPPPRASLLEETGYAGGSPRLLASYSPNPALHENLAHFVVIENCCRVADPRWDSNEEIQSRLVRASGLWPMVKSGEIYHSIAINCAFFLEKFLAGAFGGNAGGGACR